MKDIIRKVLKEEVTNKQLILLNYVNQNGVLMTLNLLGGFVHFNANRGFYKYKDKWYEIQKSATFFCIL